MRLHPLAIPYRVATSVARAAGPLLVLGFATGAFVDLSFAPLVWLGVAMALVVLALWEIAYVSLFVIEVDDDTLAIRAGVIARRDRDIPIDRIHNVDVRQNVIQRVLGIAEVDVETAGGADSEATLRYVDLQTADRLRRLRESAEEGPTVEDERLYEVTRRELALLGLLSWDLRVLSGISVAASLVGQSVLLGPLGFEGIEDLVRSVGFVPLVAGFLVIVLASGVLSGATSIAEYWGFQLVRTDDELRYERGLFRRYEGTIPLGKVQAASVAEPVAMRWFGYGSLTIATAGYGPGEDRTRVAAVPIADIDRVWDLLGAIEPVERGTFERPPSRARRRYAVRYTIALSVLAAVNGLVLARFVPSVPWYVGLAPMVGLLAVPVAAHLKWASRGYRFDAGHVVTRNGWWRRHTVVVPDFRVQTVIDRASPFQRRWSLATVVVDTAVGGGSGATDAVVPDLDADDAVEVRETVAERLRSALVGRGTGA